MESVIHNQRYICKSRFQTMNRELKRVKAFVSKWKDGGREKQDTHKYWEELVECLLGVEHGRDLIDFEKEAPIPVITTEDGGSTKYIDCYLTQTHCIIEQKSSTISLDKELLQSDSKSLNAIQQAQRYYDRLSRLDRGKYTIACNFVEFIIKDQDKPAEEPFRLKLESLPDHWRYMRRILNGGQLKENELLKDATAKTASGIVKQLYDLLKKQYKPKELTKEVLHSMNVFCVRTVFCLYADDAGVFNDNQFSTFLEAFDASKLQEKFKWLFYRLDKQKAEDMLDSEIKAFPYVNGGLFHEKVEIPRISEEIKQLLLNCTDGLTMPDGTPFSWNNISPTNFGCIFESTLDPETRRSNGMHYTSPENIRKVIGPLFLNDLKNELDSLLALPKNEQKEKLLGFQKKLRLTTFLDPACGSGNFLTETFKELRRLEMKAILQIPNYGLAESEIRDRDVFFKSPYVVDIDQFYGIEINDFAVEVAKTSLWIAHCQMVDEAEEFFGVRFEPLPLSSNANIHHADALLTDWKKITPRRKVNYIIGNPPFDGSQLMSDDQKKSLNVAMNNKIWGKTGKMDFVCAWYAKAAEYMQGSTTVKAALVSTNSITQGDQVSSLWKPLVDYYKVQILFAWKSFVWESEAKEQAAVHCVIIGFCNKKPKELCRLYDKDGNVTDCKRINAYLLPAEQLFLGSPQKHIQGSILPPMRYGSMPNDTVEVLDPSVPKGKRKEAMLRLTEAQRNDLISRYPELESYLPRIYGSEDFINGDKNYCIWLDENAPHSIRNHPALLPRFNSIRQRRLESTRKETKLLADTPYMFGEVRQPKNDYLLIPRTSSERRKYIPMGYVSPDIICSDACLTIEDCPKWVFSVLESKLHMAWIKIVCGRLKSDYRYSASVVYNNFPWPILTNEEKNSLETAATKLLEARDNELLGQTYEKIFDPDYIPTSTYTKALKDNDTAVFNAYSSMGITPSMSDEEIALALLRVSVKIAKKQAKAKTKKRTRRKKIKK